MEAYIETLKEKVPSAFRTREEGAEHGASELYQFMTTSDVIEIMDQMGWKVWAATQTRSKKYPTTCKHLIRFRNDAFGEIDGIVPEILLINSHNRTSSLTFHVGLFRIICTNGLVVANTTFEKLSVRHVGRTFDDVRAQIMGIGENLPTIINGLEKYRKVQLTKEQKLQMAMDAMVLRYPEYRGEDGVVNYRSIQDNIDINDLLKPNRDEDQSDDAFTVMNVLQEKLVKGMYIRRSMKSGKVSKAKEVKNIRTNVMLNQGLWKLMDNICLN